MRVLLDFGREVVGYHEFEIDAPAGAIVDDHNFEFIQPDGRFNLTEGMNNSLRYVCREGVQRYRTLVRRGFVYSWLSFRNFDRPRAGAICSRAGEHLSAGAAGCFRLLGRVA